jgi:hypothetical protein
MPIIWRYPVISKEQVEELAKWAGFRDAYELDGRNGWLSPEGLHILPHDLPDFPTDLNACFKYIVPKLQSIGWMARVQWSPLFDNDTGKRLSDWTGYAHIYNIDRNKPLSRTADYYAIDKESATALCLAVLKLIKEEKE